MMNITKRSALASVLGSRNRTTCWYTALSRVTILLRIHEDRTIITCACGLYTTILGFKRIIVIVILGIT
jgi:hypothetical protein